MKISQLAVNKPVTTWVCVILITLFGLVSMSGLPIQMKPSVERPVINISTLYPGAAPVEVEEQITDRLEEEVNSVEGLYKLSSQSSDSVSRITMEFDLGVDRDARFLDVLQKVSKVSGFPEEVERPTINAASADEQDKIIWIMVTSEQIDEKHKKLNVEEMSQWANKEIKDTLGRVEGVGSIEVFGKREREISIILKPKTMTLRQVTVAMVRQALLRENQNVRGGYLDEGKQRFHVRTIGKYKNLKDIENTIVVRNQTGTVYLREIAEVKSGHERTASIVRGDGKPMLALGISRKHGANVVEVTKKIEAAVEELNKQFHSFNYLGDKTNITLTVAYREADYIWESLEFLQQNLLLGSLLASLVLLFFLKSLRATLIVSLVIPICFISIFIFLQMFNRTINIISLAGIAFAIGMTVDNAIVVIENIYRHLEMGKNRKQAALDGTIEVWGAILASTLTTIAVFLPILYIKEEAGLLFKDITLTISCSVAVSLFLSLTVIPMLGARLLLRPSEKKQKPKWVVILSFPATVIYGFFNRAADLVTGKYWQGRIWSKALAVSIKLFVIIAMGIGATLVSIKYVPPLEYLPTGNRNMILVIYQLHTGLNINKGADIAYGMEQKLLNMVFDESKGDTPENIIPERMFSIVSPQFNVIGVILKNRYARMPVDKLPMKVNPMTKKKFQSSLDYVKFRMTGMIYGTAGTKFALAVKPGLFTFGGKNFEVEVTGPDLKKLDEIASKLQGKIAKLGYGYPWKEFELGLPEIHIKIKRDKAANMGLTTAEVAEVVETLVAGRKTGKYRDGNDEIDILVQGDPQLISHIDDLRNASFTVPGKGSTTVDSVADIRVDIGPTRIFHSERERAVTFTVSLPDEKPLQEAVDQVTKEVIDPERKKLPTGYFIRLTGSASDIEKTIHAFSFTAFLSLAIIYLLMASLFESFFYPLIIMFSVPLAISGSILGVHFNEVPLDMLTLLGFIILCGIVVNNAILVVHQALNFEKEGMDSQEAIRRSIESRLRPIFMSTVTTVCGMLPMCIKGSPGSELYSGLGTAIVGGLTFSTLFTLLVVPALLSLLYDCKIAIRNIWNSVSRKGE